MTLFQDIKYVNDGYTHRGDILVDQRNIALIREPGTIPCPARARLVRGDEDTLLLPGVIDEHIHSREPGMTEKGDLASETRAAAAGGVTSVIDMPNVIPPTTTWDKLSQRFGLGDNHSFVNYSFYFGATNTNAGQLQLLEPRWVPAVKVFMGRSTGDLFVDSDVSRFDIFKRSPIPIIAHCEDTGIIHENLERIRERMGREPSVMQHHLIRSREACIASACAAAGLARMTKKRLIIAHVTTKEELELADDYVTLEACVPHLLFTNKDYRKLGTLIKSNPSVKLQSDREALRKALSDGRITMVATDHAPHLLEEKQQPYSQAPSGMPMVQFSLVAMLQLVDEGVLTVERLVQLMCHNPSDYFQILGRGYIQEGMRADLVLVKHRPWTLKKEHIFSKCGWSPLEGRKFNWKVISTYCNGRRIYHEGVFAATHEHAERLIFDRESVNH